MNTIGLTVPQARALTFIAQYMLERGLSPTIGEVAEFMGHKSRTAAHGILCGLRERGRIDWTDHKERSIILVPDTPGAYTLPPPVQAKLDRYCATMNERPADVLADAVALHLDVLEGVVPELAQ